MKPIENLRIFKIENPELAPEIADIKIAAGLDNEKRRTMSCGLIRGFLTNPIHKVLLFGAEANDKLVGYAKYTDRFFGDENIWLDYLAVRPEYFKEHVGRILLRESLGYLSQIIDQDTTVRLICGNRQHKFYSCFGFQSDGPDYSTMFSTLYKRRSI